MKIIRNIIQCKHCKQIIESLPERYFVLCGCRKVGIDGGKEWLKRLGNKDDYIDLAEWT